MHTPSGQKCALCPLLLLIKTATVLQEIFVRYGLLQQLVSDNGSQFVAEEFSLFLKLNGVKHI